MEHQGYKPKTEFGQAVAEINFGRVCPKCGTKWSDVRLWRRDTKIVDYEIKQVYGYINEKASDCDGIHKFRYINIPAIFVIKTKLHRHRCGGIMLDEGEDISCMKLVSNRAQIFAE